GVADHAAAWLDDRLRDAVAEMATQRAKNRLAVGSDARDVLEIAGREAAAEIDHLELDAALGEIAEDRGGDPERPVPHARVALLRADVERQAVRNEAERLGAFEHARRHLRRAAELARQRPIRPRS